MKQLTEKGVTTTQKKGEESYLFFNPPHNPQTTYCQYDFRHINGRLFSIVKPTLKKCRDAKDRWIDFLDFKRNDY